MLLDNLSLKRLRFLLLVLLFCPAIVFSQSDISVKQGNYEVFYSVFNTSFLSPETATAIGAVRAKDKAMLNISIRENSASGESKEVKASIISGNTFDLIHRKKMDFQEVVETGAIYYLATFSISNNDEFIQISADVLPEGSTEVIKVRFKRKFFFN